jgi:hypothetical protein
LLHPGREKRPAGELAQAELQTAWDDLANTEPRIAYQAVARLIVNSNKSLPFFKGRVKPSSEVTVGKVLRELDDESFDVRQAASQTLWELGPAIRPALQHALADSPSAEARRRLEAALERFQSEQVAPTVRRQQRAVQILERIGSDEARQLLEELAKGRETAEQTRAARAALRRLGQTVGETK